jgi:hypothetical protein
VFVEWRANKYFLRRIWLMTKRSPPPSFLSSLSVFLQKQHTAWDYVYILALSLQHSSLALLYLLYMSPPHSDISLLCPCYDDSVQRAGRPGAWSCPPRERSTAWTASPPAPSSVGRDWVRRRPIGRRRRCRPLPERSTGSNGQTADEKNTSVFYINKSNLFWLR